MLPDTPELHTLPKSGIFLAFDYGQKRIGSALGDRITQQAHPLQQLANEKNSLWKHIQTLIDTWQPCALVVGVPLNEDGERQTMTDAAEKFIRRLHGRYQLPVYAAEERYTSLEADLRTGNAGRDSKAAAIILEDFLLNNGET